jgi:hypothetical protein
LKNSGKIKTRKRDQWEKAQEAGRIWRHVISTVTKAKVNRRPPGRRCPTLPRFSRRPVGYPKARHGATRNTRSPRNAYTGKPSDRKRDSWITHETRKKEANRKLNLPWGSFFCFFSRGDWQSNRRLEEIGDVCHVDFFFFLSDQYLAVSGADEIFLINYLLRYYLRLNKIPIFFNWKKGSSIGWNQRRFASSLTLSGQIVGTF